MNHAFSPSKLNVIICASCSRNMLAHTNSAECEACGKIGKADIINEILMCEACFSKEITATSELTSTDANSTISNKPTGFDIEESVSSQIYTTARTIAADLPANGSEYYNSKILAIVELEAKINNDPAIENKAFFFAGQIQARQNHLYKTLVSVRELITEIDAERHANFRAINALASRLRKEEREKLNIKYAEYVPPTKVGKVSQPRLSAQDKVIEGMAKMMFAPRIDGIIQWEALEKSERQGYIEKAKQYFKGNLKP